MVYSLCSPFFQSWQVFLILFKPINKLAHYSVYVLNRYRGSIDILDSLPYSKKGMSRTRFHEDCTNIVSFHNWTSIIGFFVMNFILPCFDKHFLCMVGNTASKLCGWTEYHLIVELLISFSLIFLQVSIYVPEFSYLFNMFLILVFVSCLAVQEIRWVAGGGARQGWVQSEQAAKLADYCKEADFCWSSKARE